MLKHIYFKFDLKVKLNRRKFVNKLVHQFYIITVFFLKKFDFHYYKNSKLTGSDFSHEIYYTYRTSVDTSLPLKQQAVSGLDFISQSNSMVVLQENTTSVAVEIVIKQVMKRSIH